MADLEKDAMKRDHGFLVRLVLALVVALLAGLFIFAHLTSDRSQGCAAETFEDVTDAPPSE